MQSWIYIVFTTSRKPACPLRTQMVDEAVEYSRKWVKYVIISLNSVLGKDRSKKRRLRWRRYFVLLRRRTSRSRIRVNAA